MAERVAVWPQTWGVEHSPWWRQVKNSASAKCVVLSAYVWEVGKLCWSILQLTVFFFCTCRRSCPFSNSGDKVPRMKIELNFWDGQDRCFSQATAMQQHPSLLISVCHSVIRSCYKLFWFPQTTKAEAFSILLFVYYSYNKLLAYESELSKSGT